MVSNSASATTPVTDGWGARGNTIEFGSNGKLTISANAKVQALGTDTMGEAVNVMGGGNTIINYGLISAVSAPAIWFQDLVGCTQCDRELRHHRVRRSHHQQRHWQQRQRRRYLLQP